MKNINPYTKETTNVKNKKQEKNDDTGKRRYLKPIVKSSMEKRQGYQHCKRFLTVCSRSL